MSKEMMIPPSLEVLEAILLNAEGNLDLAAERAHISKSQLLETVTSDPSSFERLQQKIRAFSLIRTLELVSLITITFKASIPDLSPFEVSKSLQAMLSAINSLSTNPTSQTTSINNNISVTDVVMKMLPPEARAALIELSGKDGKET